MLNNHSNVNTNPEQLNAVDNEACRLRHSDVRPVICASSLKLEKEVMSDPVVHFQDDVYDKNTETTCQSYLNPLLKTGFQPN